MQFTYNFIDIFSARLPSTVPRYQMSSVLVSIQVVIGALQHNGSSSSTAYCLWLRYKLDTRRGFLLLTRESDSAFYWFGRQCACEPVAQ